MAKQKTEFLTIEALVGSLIICPEEIAILKKQGIDLPVLLKNIQKIIVKTEPAKIQPKEKVKPLVFDWTKIDDLLLRGKGELALYYANEIYKNNPESKEVADKVKQIEEIKANAVHLIPIEKKQEGEEEYIPMPN